MRNWVLSSALAFVFLAMLSGAFFLIDANVGTRIEVVKFSTGRTYSWAHPNEITWAPLATKIAAGIILFNLLVANILKTQIERQGRNWVAWATAIILFTPFLAGGVYLLTWPRVTSPGVD